MTARAPVIDSVTPAGPVSKPFGGTVTVTVVAHDADARTETLSIVATDAEGNASTPAQVQLTWTDPVTITATLPAGSPSTVSVVGNVVTVVGG